MKWIGCHIVLVLSVLNAWTVNGQTDSLNNAYDPDSALRIDQVLSESLVIPSYEELLEVYYKAVVAVDKRLNNNPYRLMPGNFASVNPFVYDDVLLPNDSMPDLEDYESGFPQADVFDKSALQILYESRDSLAFSNPDVITATWNQLPDAPKAEKADIIYSVNLDLSGIDRYGQINKPEKIVKQKYIYHPWNTQVWSMLNINQTAFSNWAKGGLNSFAISGRIVADADYISNDKKTQWANDGEVRLGYVQQEEKPFVKNLDLFRLNTQFARNAFNRWYYAMNTELTSQFFQGYDLKNDNYDDPISAFFAPAYLKLDIGLDYKYGTKKNKKLFSVQASPLSYKLTYVRDTALINQKKYGVDTDKKNRQEIGGSVLFVGEYAYNEKFRGKSRLLFFSNYRENPQNVDLNWNTTMTYHFSRIFSVTFTLDMIYDDDVAILLNEAEDGTKTYGQRLQVKEFLGFGLAYRLM